ncbi:MAG: carbohydrate porin [Gammaproteobacteria bacterium]|nr:carbohydrate porin [Gammaproteobacteria bacterium]
MHENLAAAGIDLALSTRGTYQNIVAGGYTGADDALGATTLALRLDTARAGAWSGGELRLRAEARYGGDVQAAFGGFDALDVDQLLPADPARFGRSAIGLSEAVYQQSLGDYAKVYAGLVNSLGDEANPLAGSLASHDRFLNAALLAAPVRLRLAPEASVGAGVLLSLPRNVSADLRVQDGDEAVGRSPFALRAGTIVTNEWRWNYSVMGHPGSVLAGARYGFDRSYSSAGSEAPAALARLAPSAALHTRQASWAAYYDLAQSLGEWGGGRGWGVFWRHGYGDNDVNPVDWSVAFGVVATGPWEQRPHDTAGWGYFHVYQVDGALLRHYAYDDEQGWEAWYNAELAPWLHVTLDLQMIDSDIDRRHPGESSPVLAPGGLMLPAASAGELTGAHASDLSWVFGLRTEIAFAGW